MLRKKISTKIIFSFILIFNTFSCYSQTINNFSTTDFVDQIDSFFDEGEYISTEGFDKKELIKNYLSLNDEEKLYFINLANSLAANKAKEYLSFFNYFNWLSSNNIDGSSSIKKILLYHYFFLYYNDNKSSRYFSNLWEKVNSKVFISSTSHKIYSESNFSVGVEDFLDYSLYDNSGGLLGTLVFSFRSSDIKLETETSDFFLTRSNFSYYPDLDIIQGEVGKIKSKLENSFFGDLDFVLNNFSIDLKSCKIISTNASLSSGGFRNIKGAFEYVLPSSQKRYANYFNFISNDSDIDLVLDDNVKLRAGLSINKDKITTKSLSDNYSEAKFILERGKRISAKSKSFLINEGTIKSSETYFNYYDNIDSLYHPMVDFNFDMKNKKIRVLNIEGVLKNTSFFSSYFNIEFQPDILNYNIGDSKIYFGMIIAPNQRPLRVYSNNFFSNQILNEQTDLNGTNILKATYSYSSKAKRLDFYIDDLASYFKTKRSMIEGGVLGLWRNGFISYERGTGLIKVLPKLRHYYRSHLKRSDFDEFNFNSLSVASNNLTYDIESNTMLFQGVDKVTISKKNNMIVYPKNGLIELRKNREVKTIGDLSVGNFDFNGVNLTFDYEKYLIDLIEIDTLKMLSKNTGRDSYNYLFSIGGDLFINHPKNKSSRRSLQSFPSFISDKSTKVYFDMPEVYGPEYDSSFYFAIDQFRIDSLDKSSLPKFEFPGTFYSNNILLPIEGKLITMPDNSFGFNMLIGDEGVGAYDNKITLYNNLLMDSTGLYVEGSMKYNTTRIFSEKIRLFPDSLEGSMEKGFMMSGNISNKKFKYPDFELSDMLFSYYNMDNDYVFFDYDSLKSSQVIAYNNRAQIIGDIYISSNSVKSEGAVIANGSTFLSDEFSYNDSFIVSEDTDVSLEHPSHKGGLLKGKNLFFKFDLAQNSIDAKSSYYDNENFVLPYYDLTTSLNEAVWKIDENLLSIYSSDVNHSAFSQSDLFKDWGFGLENIMVDVSKRTLYGNGVKEIQIADAYIIPNDEKLILKEGFNFEKLSKSVLLLDTVSEFHRFINSEIFVKSKDEFEGRGVYEYVNFNLDTFNIPFSEFEISQSEDGKKSSFTRGEVEEDSPILMEPGFNFYGKIDLYGNSEKLLFDGRIIPSELSNFNRKNAIIFNDYFVPGDELALNISDEIGLFNAAISRTRTGGLLFDFFNNSVDEKSLVFFNPNGLLSFDPFTRDYLIESKQKRDQEVYNGNSLLYKPEEKNVAFEGAVNLINNDVNFNMLTSMSGFFNLDSLNIEAETFMILDINLKKSIVDEIGFAFNDIIETYGAPIAHDNEQDVLVRLSDLIGNDKTVAYENSILSEYRPLTDADGILNSIFVFPNTKFSWSQKEKAWYNASSVNLSNIGPRDVNASIDGFIEIAYTDESQYLFNLFLQPAPELWLYMGYDGVTLSTFSSNERYNSEMLESSRSRDKFVPVRLVDESIVLDYINNFRLKYFGIKEPYNLMSPSDTFLEDEVFETISDDDDGF